MKSILLLLAFMSIALARDAREQARIDFLLRDVEQSKSIVFIRNGAEHDASAAAKHLRAKLNYAGERVRTAEDFITSCASESSLTHQKYKVRLPDGKTLNAADYLLARLHEYDATAR